MNKIKKPIKFKKVNLGDHLIPPYNAKEAFKKHNEKFFELKFTTNFEAAHQLEDTPSLTTKKCMSLHGHSYKVLIRIKTTDLIDGFVCDFGALKTIIDTLDHTCLNQVLDFNPTCENLVSYLQDQIIEKTKKKRFYYKVRVEVFETEKASIACYE